MRAGVRKCLPQLYRFRVRALRPRDWAVPLAAGEVEDMATAPRASFMCLLYHADGTRAAARRTQIAAR